MPSVAVVSRRSSTGGTLAGSGYPKTNAYDYQQGNAPPMDEFSSRYLDAFNAIEKWLRDQVPGSDRYDFPSLVDAASESHYGVRRNAGRLKDLNRFRNFVVHDFSRQRALAVPTQWAADLITSVKQELLSPEPLLSFAATPVATCQPTDPITLAVQKMREGRSPESHVRATLSRRRRRARRIRRLYGPRQTP